MKRTSETKMVATQKLAQKQGVLRARDLTKRGIPRSYLKRLQDDGKLEKLGPGLYADANFEPTENHSLAEVCKRVPHGAVCLASALRVHGLTTQAPFQVWLAIDVHAWRPKQTTPPIRVVHMGNAARKAGVEIRKIEGVDVSVFGPAKTVADCFKYRNKIGLDVALEALREFKKSKHFNHDELWRFAKICRVANIMRPYLEGMS
jgi:predicted transcriptional regulator of viral defense system